MRLNGQDVIVSLYNHMRIYAYDYIINQEYLRRRGEGKTQRARRGECTSTIFPKNFMGSKIFNYFLILLFLLFLINVMIIMEM